MDDQYKTTNLIGANPISDSFFNGQKRLVLLRSRLFFGILKAEKQGKQALNP